MLKEVLKICEKMMSADVKANLKQQEIKEVTAVAILKLFIRSTFKT